MKQTHSICLSLRINFEYPEQEKKYAAAIRQAIQLAMNPNLTDKKNGTKVTGVLLYDPECPSICKAYGDI